VPPAQPRRRIRVAGGEAHVALEPDRLARLDPLVFGEPGEAAHAVLSHVGVEGPLVALAGAPGAAPAVGRRRRPGGDAVDRLAVVERVLDPDVVVGAGRAVAAVLDLPHPAGRGRGQHLARLRRLDVEHLLGRALVVLVVSRDGDLGAVGVGQPVGPLGAGRGQSEGEDGEDEMAHGAASFHRSVGRSRVAFLWRWPHLWPSGITRFILRSKPVVAGIDRHHCNYRRTERGTPVFLSELCFVPRLPPPGARARIAALDPLRTL